MAEPCVNTLANGSICGGKRTAGIHSIHHPEYHPYWNNKPVGMPVMSEGMRNYRQESGYDAAVRQAKGKPCQIGSPVCTGTAEHLHELLSRGRAGGLRAAVEIGGTVDACDACNDYCEVNPVWAAEHGWSFSNTIEGRKAAKEAKAARNLEQEPAIVKVKPDPYQNSQNSNESISKAANSPSGREPCIGNDPACPCQDGDPCHYKPYKGTPAASIFRRKHTTTEGPAVPKPPRSRLRGK